MVTVSRTAITREVLFSGAWHMLQWLALSHLSSVVPDCGTYPDSLAAYTFEPWRSRVSGAPAPLLEPFPLRTLLEQALAEAQLQVTERHAARVGSARLAEILRDFAATVDLARFAEVGELPYSEWVARVIRRPEAPAGNTPGDRELRDDIERMSPELSAVRTEVELRSATGTLGDLSPLERLPRLRRLVIADAKVLTDLSPLGALRELEVLTIEAPRVADLRPLASLGRLRRLELRTTRALDLGPLAALGSLEDLKLEGDAVVADIAPLARLPLVKLTLAAVRCDLAPLAAMRALRQLDLGWSAGASGFSVLGELTWLRTLAVTDVPSESLEPLAPLTALKELTVSAEDLRSLRGIEPLRGLEKLTLLIGPQTDVTALAELPELRDLSICNARIHALGPIARLPRLERLSLLCTELASLEGLQEARGLRELDIVTRQVGDLTPIAGLEALETLAFEGDGALEDIGPLRGLRNLRSVSVPISSIASVEALAGLPELRAVDVSHCRRLDSLLPLGSCPKLETIRWDGCERLRGPRTVEALRAERSQDGAKVHPSAEPAPAAPGAGQVLLRVEPSPEQAVGEAPVEMDVRVHLPAPLPKGWRVEKTREPEDVACRIVTPEGAMVIRVGRSEGSDAATLAVGITPPEGGPPYVGDERARAWLKLLRVRTAFEELGQRPYTEGQGGRVFVARV